MELRKTFANWLVRLGNGLGSDAGVSVVPVPVVVAETEPTDLAQESAIRQLLEACARAFVPAGRHVRSNVMTFIDGGARRRVNAATA